MARFEQLLSLALPERVRLCSIWCQGQEHAGCELCTGCGGQQVCNGEACCAF